MKFLLKKAGLITAVTGCICLLLGAVVLAESDERFYVRFAGADQEISRDFNGVKTYNLSSEIAVTAPKLKKATGYGFAFGSQNGHVGGELSYFKTSHDSESGFGSISDERLNYDVKLMVLDPMEINVTPYAMVGLSYDRIQAENGAKSSSTTGNAEYLGLGYKVGAGLLIRFNDNLALDGSYTVGRAELDKVKAMGAEGDPKFKLESKVLSLSLNYYF